MQAIKLFDIHRRGLSASIYPPHTDSAPTYTPSVAMPIGRLPAPTTIVISLGTTYKSRLLF